MPRSRGLGLIVLALVAGVGGCGVEAREDPRPGPPRCGADEVTAELRAEIAARLRASTPAAEIEVPVNAWLIVGEHEDPDGRREGRVDELELRYQLERLNDALAWPSVTVPVERGCAHREVAELEPLRPRIRFRLSSITEVESEAWFHHCDDRAVEKEMIAAVRAGGPEALNLYTCAPERLRGWASYPWELEVYPDEDGLILRHTTLRPGAEGEDTLIHEVGHWLGLLHTFAGGCDELAGDEVPDTPAVRLPNRGCPAGVNTCAGPDDRGPDPVHNYMDYTDDGCTYELTPGQLRRVADLWSLYRAPHYPPGAGARKAPP